MSSTRYNVSLAVAALAASCGLLNLYIGSYAIAQWAFMASLAVFRVYELEQFIFENWEDDDDGDNAADPVPTEPSDDANWWKGQQ